ncbi:MAG TPA: nuclear transport factor 2 family protein [Terriglobales bacterium]|nr:nuclear transport factor 2 family protein [Terriglobales bacterium]
MLVLVSAAGVQGQQPESTAETSKLMALENAWNQAQLHHDSKSLEDLIGDGFIYTDTDGSVMNKQQFLTDNDDPNYRATVMTNDEVQVYSYPNTAIVAGRYHAKGTYKGKPFDHYGRFTDTWIYFHGIWQCVASHTTLLGK